MRGLERIPVDERFLLFWRQVPYDTLDELREQVLEYRDAMTERHGRSIEGDLAVQAVVDYAPSDTSRLLRVLRCDASLLEARAWDSVFELRPHGRWLNARSHLLFALGEGFAPLFGSAKPQTYIVAYDFLDGVPPLVEELPFDGFRDGRPPRIGICNLRDRDAVRASIDRLTKYQS